MAAAAAKVVYVQPSQWHTNNIRTNDVNTFHMCCVHFEWGAFAHFHGSRAKGSNDFSMCVCVFWQFSPTVVLIWKFRVSSATMLITCCAKGIPQLQKPFDIHFRLVGVAERPKGFSARIFSYSSNNMRCTKFNLPGQKSDGLSRNACH